MLITSFELLNVTPVVFWVEPDPKDVDPVHDHLGGIVNKKRKEQKAGPGRGAIKVEVISLLANEKALTS